MYVKFTENGIPGWFGLQPVEDSEPLDMGTLPYGITDLIDFLISHRMLDGLWVVRDPVVVIPPTEAEVAAAEAALVAETKLAEDAAKKMSGVEFEGVMCSATSQDQAGLMAVLTGIQLQGAGFTPTRFEFENGTSVVIHLGNYRDFIARWLPFRQAFFRAN